MLDRDIRMIRYYANGEANVPPELRDKLVIEARSRIAALTRMLVEIDPHHRITAK